MNPIEKALAVTSREELVDYLADLSSKARQKDSPMENPSTPEFIEAASAWLEGLDPFLRYHIGEDVPNQPTWSTIAMIFSAGLIYE